MSPVDALNRFVATVNLGFSCTGEPPGRSSGTIYTGASLFSSPYLLKRRFDQRCTHHGTDCPAIHLFAVRRRRFSDHQHLPA
ncbi:hypothetical protein RB283 [Rhodopirellula baltica SH 1]|uniref:Uncharacterized protein n=1 Tax=Rhodopirellula baltica (strain DSM 10527 / NCIMB 13988 / SH1) TaxID=243090 RepID=Q7UZ02_RHOBA|nr:hypothetical protein RB283 [Rhodopirellula baltica SH 1]